VALCWLQLLDSLRPGWQSLAYFHDIVQVAAAADQQQQQAALAMQSCDAAAPPAAAVGAMLLLERHSIFVERQHQQIALLQAHIGQSSDEDWSRLNLTRRISSQPVRKRLAAALSARDANESRHDVASLTLAAARLAQEKSPGSEPLVLKSSLPPAVDSPATRAVYAELFGSVFSRVAAGSSQTYSAAAGYLLRCIWVQASDCGRLSAAASEYVQAEVGYQYAVSQLHVRSAASSPAVAELLLGSSALDESCLRWALQLRSALTCRLFVSDTSVCRESIVPCPVLLCHKSATTAASIRMISMCRGSKRCWNLSTPYSAADSVPTRAHCVQPTGMQGHCHHCLELWVGATAEWYHLLVSFLCRAVAAAEASIAQTSAPLLASCAQYASSSSARPLTTCGITACCSDLAEHMRALIQVMHAAGQLELRVMWAPLVAAGGQAAKLPPELQPYHLHMKAALADR
jgi:hypothetical protein